MCDYSLHLLTSRPAKVGDKLVTTKFVNSITRGFATVEEPTVAVCLLPGTEVAFEKDIIELPSYSSPQPEDQGEGGSVSAGRYRQSEHTSRRT